MSVKRMKTQIVGWVFALIFCTAMSGSALDWWGGSGPRPGPAGPTGTITNSSSWTAEGDLIVGHGNGTAQILPIGNDGQFLHVNGTVIEWFTHTDGSAGGGDITTDNAWDQADQLIVSHGDDSADVLDPPAAPGYFLHYNGTVNWSPYTLPATVPTPSTASQGKILHSNGTNIVASTATYPATLAVNQLMYGSATNVISGMATANSSVLITSGGGIPAWGADLPSGVTHNSGTIYTTNNVVAMANGGTGLSDPGTAGNVLHYNGTVWESTPDLTVQQLNLGNADQAIPWTISADAHNTGSTEATEGVAHWNSSTNSLSIGDGEFGALTVMIASHTYGGLIFGDDTPDDAGEIGYSSGFKFQGNSENVRIYPGSASNTVAIQTDSGVDTIDAGAMSIITTGTISGATKIVSQGAGTNLTVNAVTVATEAGLYTLPNSCDTATGAWVMVVSNGANAVDVDPYDTDDYIVYKGLGLAGGDKLRSASAIQDSVVMVCLEAHKWYVTANSGTWTDEN